MTTKDNQEKDWKSILQNYYPICIEGPGPSNDIRDPHQVAKQLTKQLLCHWKRNNRNVTRQRSATTGVTLRQHDSITVDDKPILILTQGDPPASTGVAAISMGIFHSLSGKCGAAAAISDASPLVPASSKSSTIHKKSPMRVLVTLDDPEHITYADRREIFMELRLSQLMEFLSEGNDENSHDSGEKNCKPNVMETNIDETPPNRIKDALRNHMKTLTAQVQHEMTPSIKAQRESTEQFALLQEITKAAFRKLCNGITVLHTVEKNEISPCSVTGFYDVGIELGLVNEDEYVAFDAGYFCEETGGAS